mgnify:CR=1 FL=1
MVNGFLAPVFALKYIYKSECVPKCYRKLPYAHWVEFHENFHIQISTTFSENSETGL